MNNTEDELREYIRKIRKEYRGLTETRIGSNDIWTRFGQLNRLDDCSKKLPLITDRAILYEEVQSKTDKMWIDSFSYSGNHDSYTVGVYYRTNNLQHMLNWFSNSSKMLLSERIVYVPYTECIYDGYFDGDYNHKTIDTVDISPSKLFMAVPDENIMVSDPNVIPLFQLDIPGFEGITPSQLSQIMDDHPDKLLRFRNHIQRKLLEFKSSLGSEDFAREIRLVELDIKDGLLRLRDDMKKLSKTTAIEIIGAQAITWTIYVFVFLNTPNELLKVILPGGALAALTTNYAKYFSNKFAIGNDPLSFLLLIPSQAKKR